MRDNEKVQHPSILLATASAVLDSQHLNVLDLDSICFINWDVSNIVKSFSVSTVIFYITHQSFTIRLLYIFGLLDEYTSLKIWETISTRKGGVQWTKPLQDPGTRTSGMEARRTPNKNSTGCKAEHGQAYH
jgi:hypothetical protein